MTDVTYMRRAMELAELGHGWVSPNPMVGAVLVKDGVVIGEGYHRHYGGLHAERDALAHCTQSPEGATLYVTLEPCCHTGKQPPCTDAIFEAGIRRVVVASKDPNPLVAGKGIEKLCRGGVEVTEGVLEEECNRQNEVFFHYIQSKQPFVVMKYAMTLDGKIAAYTGASKWITGEAARMHVQEQRHRYTAIMVGVGTVLADDPLLTCRLPKGKNPIRVICDTKLSTPLSAQVVKTAKTVPTIFATCSRDAEKIDRFQAAGCRILPAAELGGHVDLKVLMLQLGEEQIDSILLEGGGTLNWAALSAGIVQKVQAYVAPKLLGGQAARTPVEGVGFASPGEAVQLTDSRILKLGEDFLIESEVSGNVYRNH